MESGVYVGISSSYKTFLCITGIQFHTSGFFGSPGGGHHLFESLFDLVRGYHQVPVHPPDMPKTAVIAPFGLFEVLRMPFALKVTIHVRAVECCGM